MYIPELIQMCEGNILMALEHGPTDGYSAYERENCELVAPDIGNFCPNIQYTSYNTDFLGTSTLLNFRKK